MRPPSAFAPRRTVIVTMLLACSTACGGNRASRSEPQLAATRLLLELRDAVSGRAQAGRSLVRLPPLDPLRGTREETLLEVLGQPTDCRSGNRMGLPCRSPDDWVYRFFSVSSGSGEQGPYLVIGFDDGRRVERAEWGYAAQ